jgi:hypothetical protein
VAAILMSGDLAGSPARRRRGARWRHVVHLSARLRSHVIRDPIKKTGMTGASLYNAFGRQARPLPAHIMSWIFEAAKGFVTAPLSRLAAHTTVQGASPEDRQIVSPFEELAPDEITECGHDQNSDRIPGDHKERTIVGAVGRVESRRNSRRGEASDGSRHARI